MYLQELEYYLKSFKSLIPKLKLEKQLYVEGTTIGQVTFHATQAANHWMRVIILRQTFERNRDLEFKAQPTLEKIQTSIDQAIEACNELKKANPDLNLELVKPVNIMPMNFEAK